jgi:hypothetical protein
MVNLISGLETAADARTAFDEGACLRPAAVRAAQSRQGATVFVRPRAFWASDVFGQRHPAAGLTTVAFGQPDPYKQNPYLTRIAAMSGGAKGPHPAREPEPV